MGQPIRIGVSRNHGRSTSPDWPKVLAGGIAAVLGQPVEADLCEDYDQLLSRFVEKQVELAWLPPLLHARAAKTGARLVAVPQRSGWLTFRSALLVRKDHPARDARSLRGARAAWRDRSSASGYVFPRLELARLGSPPDKAFSSEKFYGSVVDAANAVVRGEADLCTCFVTDPAAHDAVRARFELGRVLGEIAEQLRILHVTDPIPPDGIMVGPQVPDAEREAITRALLSLHQNDHGLAALELVLQAERLAPVNDAVLRTLRSWADAAAARAG